jgi:hypothetical protein
MDDRSKGALLRALAEGGVRQPSGTKSVRYVGRSNLYAGQIGGMQPNGGPFVIGNLGNDV